MLIPLDLLQQVSVKKSKKLTKIAKVDEKVFISSERHDEFERNFQENGAYDNIKGHKKPGLHPLSIKHNFGKTKLVRQIDHQPF